MNDTRHPRYQSPTLAASAETRPPDWIGCGGCDERWTGLRTCHCSACHRTFTGITCFDMHRRGSACHDPATAGLVPVRKQHWAGWGWPGENPRWGDD